MYFDFVLFIIINLYIFARGMYQTLMQNKLIMFAHISLLKTVSDIVTGLLTSHSIDKSCKQILYLKILLFHPLTK